MTASLNTAAQPGVEPAADAMAGLAIEARGMSKTFGKVQAVRDLDLDVPRGGIYGFLGPNGSGKSTTIRMLCGLLTPTAGDISVLGHRSPEQAEALRRKVGYMTQKFSLYEDLTALENLQFMANIHSLRRSARHRRIEAVGERYHLEGFLRQRAGTLSGGQKQRLALAAATLHEPDLLFLDDRLRSGLLDHTVSHVLCHDRRGVIVNGLVDAGHNAVLHQLLDHLNAADPQRFRQMLHRHRGGKLDLAFPFGRRALARGTLRH